MADDFDPYYTWLGIRPEEQPADHYRLIGLRQLEDNADVISNALDQKMQFLRTLQVGKRSALSQKILNEISAAGGVLLDPKKKLAYDAELRGKESARQLEAQAKAAAAKPIPRPAAAVAAVPPVALPAAPRPVPVPVSAEPGVAFAPAPKANFPGLNTSSRPTSSWKLAALAVGSILAVAMVGVALWSVNRVLNLSGEKKVASSGIKHPVKPDKTETNPVIPISPDPIKPANTKPAETVPGTKTPKGNSGQAWWKDPQHVGRLLALRLGPESFVEFPDSASRCTLATPLTAELWLRLRLQGEQPVQIMGTILGGDGAVPKGWGLFAKRSAGEKPQDQLYLEFWTSSGVSLRYDPVMLPDNGWHHVAVVLEPEKAGKLCIDGKPYAFPPAKEVASSQRNLVLGSQTQPAGSTFSADVCGFRASEAVRYGTSFAPPSPLVLAMDETSFAALDSRLFQSGIATAEKPFPWLYGVGKFDQQANKIVDFQLLQYGSSRQWQGGTSRPDKKLDWVALDPVGGHPGRPNQLAVRRWIAPAGGELSVTGRLLHTHTMRAGDGVKARIVTSGGGLVDEWRAYFKEVETASQGMKVQAGDTVDFTVDCDNNSASDAFEWIVELKLVDADQRVVGTWNSAKDFRVIPNASPPKASREPLLSKAEWIPLENYSAILGAKDWNGSQERAQLAVQYAPATNPSTSTPLTLKPAPAKPLSPFGDPMPPAEVPPANRTAVPDAAALAKAKAEVLKVYSDELKAAKAPKQKQELAQKMLELVKDTTDGATKYALLDEVRRLAVEGHETYLALSAVNSLGEQFEIDLFAHKVKLFEGLAAEGLTPAQRGEALSAACDFGYEAMDADKFEALQAVVASARSMAIKATTSESKIEAKEFFDASAKKQKLFDAIKKAEQAIASAPNEPGANQTLGLYYTFTRGDQKKGLPLLAKGTDQKLSAAAKLREQNLAKGIAASLEEADAWFEAIGTTPADYKTDVQTLALQGYTSLASSGTGLEKAKAEKRRDQLALDISNSSALTGPKKVRLKDLPATSPGMVGRVLIDGKDAGILLTHEPPRDIDRDRLVQILSDAKITGAQIILAGILEISSPTSVRIEHQGRRDGPPQVVSINGKQASAVGGNFSRGFPTLQLPAGKHLVQWIIAFDGTNSPELRLVDASGGARLPLYFTREQSYEARKRPTRLEVNVTR